MTPLPNVLQPSLRGGEGTAITDERPLLSIALEVSRSFEEQMSVRGMTNVKMKPQLAFILEGYNSAGAHTFVVGSWRAWGVGYI